MRTAREATALELKTIVEQHSHVLQTFGVENIAELREIASIAVIEGHHPSMPGLCGNLVYMADCLPENPLIFIIDQTADPLGGGAIVHDITPKL